MLFSKKYQHPVKAYPHENWVFIDGRMIQNREFTLEQIQEVHPLVTDETLVQLNARRRTKLAGEMLKYTLQKPKEEKPLSPFAQRLYDRNPGMQRDFRSQDMEIASGVYEAYKVLNTEFDIPTYYSVYEFVAEKSQKAGRFILGKLFKSKAKQYETRDLVLDDILRVTSDGIDRVAREFRPEPIIDESKIIDHRVPGIRVNDGSKEPISEEDFRQANGLGQLFDEIAAQLSSEDPFKF